jgi:DNA-binding response OmpR family regulator
MMHKILIVEDNEDIANLIQMHVKDINCEADVAHDGEHGVNLFNKNDYDLVILDIMLPVLDGLEVCKRLRQKADYIPIIMLTSKSSELDRVLGLEMGADDYLTKPFSIPELIARIKSQFRRSEATTASNEPQKVEQLSFGNLLIDQSKHQVLKDGKKIELTAKEFDLLTHFATNPGRVYTRTQLLSQVWDYSYEGYEHTVNSHINRLRAKIENDPVKPEYILTVWGVGYKFNDEAQ